MNWTKPNWTKPNRTELNQTELNWTKPNQLLQVCAGWVLGLRSALRCCLSSQKASCWFMSRKVCTLRNSRSFVVQCSSLKMSEPQLDEKLVLFQREIQPPGLGVAVWPDSLWTLQADPYLSFQLRKKDTFTVRIWGRRIKPNWAINQQTPLKENQDELQTRSWGCSGLLHLFAVVQISAGPDRPAREITFLHLIVGPWNPARLFQMAPAAAAPICLFQAQQPAHYYLQLFVTGNLIWTAVYKVTGLDWQRANGAISFRRLSAGYRCQRETA